MTVFRLPNMPTVVKAPPISMSKMPTGAKKIVKHRNNPIMLRKMPAIIITTPLDFGLLNCAYRVHATLNC